MKGGTLKLPGLQSQLGCRHGCRTDRQLANAQRVHIRSRLTDPGGDNAQVNSDIMNSENCQVSSSTDGLRTDKRGQHHSFSRITCDGCDL